MKYLVRRAVASLIITPFIAGVYWLFYAYLIALGFEPTATPIGIWNNGLVLGAVVSIVFIANQAAKLIRK